MRALCVAFLLLALGMQPVQASPPTLADLRSGFAGRSGEALSAEQAREMGAQALALAGKATSRASFWNAMSFVAEICEAAPAAAARPVRAQALEALAGRFSDAMRWSSLVTDRFIPRFERLSRSEWAGELDEYDRVLDRLSRNSTDERVRAELLYAKARVRIHIERRWDWLTPAARRQTVALLDTLAGTFGELPCPGDDSRLIRDRARQHEYELANLHFGAPAPAAAGTDLMGERVDIKDYRDRIVVLDFWTSFCQPCLVMVPHVQALLDKLDGQPVVYLGINGDMERSQALRTAQRFEMTWRNLWDGSEGQAGPAFTAWNVAARGLPAVFVLDGRGRIRYKLVGLEEVQENLDGAIANLLAELP
jgi:thiol-disulfide isomerase/thioredoxin